MPSLVSTFWLCFLTKAIPDARFLPFHIEGYFSFPLSINFQNSCFKTQQYKCFYALSQLMLKMNNQYALHIVIPYRLSKALESYL